MELLYIFLSMAKYNLLTNIHVKFTYPLEILYVKPDLHQDGGFLL